MDTHEYPLNADGSRDYEDVVQKALDRLDADAADALRHVYEDLLNERARHQSTRETLQEAVEDRKMAIDRASRVTHHKKESDASFQARIDNLTAELETVRSERTATPDYCALRDRNRDLQACLKEQKEKAFTHQAQREHAEGQLATAMKTINALEVEIRDMRKKRICDKQALEKWFRRHAAQRALLDDLRAELAQAGEERAARENQVSDLVERRPDPNEPDAPFGKAELDAAWRQARADMARRTGFESKIHMARAYVIACAASLSADAAHAWRRAPERPEDESQAERGAVLADAAVQVFAASTDLIRAAEDAEGSLREIA